MSSTARFRRRRVPRAAKALAAVAVGLAALGTTAGAALGAVGGAGDGPHGHHGPVRQGWNEPGWAHHGPDADQDTDGVGTDAGPGR